ncbi:MAG: tripartite tricarboxylate transporter permease [Burkholderiales bacterium]|nr:tripartite tricarboxylate transporter permease [Burkholderiales bacterium]MDP2397808.1 tripartite tricarboxylate transporter permease [Burkholderiales bacterium]
MIDAIVAGLAALMTPQAMVFMFIGVIYGLVIGILPGLGGVVAMALLLPFTHGFEVAATLALLLGAHIATIWGSSVTGILFNVPGAAKSLTSCFDGYPMTKKGQATRALGASATGALLGGILGAIFLAVSIPLVRPIMLALGPSEYLMMALWGLTIIATFSEGSLMKGLIASVLGILIAFIGMDPVTATPRYTFDILYLMEGISFPVAMIGLFAVAEMMKLYVKGGSIVDRQLTEERSTVWQGVRDAFVHRWLIVRSSLLGVWIGVLPGVGATVGGLAAYAQAVQTSKTPERFGKGAVEGVIAPDATVGANEGGGLMPTLAFGIPGGEGMAILLVAFIGLGIVPGPDMLTKNLDLVFSMVWIIVIANIIVTIIGLGVAPYLARLPALHANLMVPAVLAVCFVGAYATRGQIEDVAMAVAFGILGYLMDKYHYSRANLVIGMVLAIMIERNLHLSLTLYGGDFLLERPVAAAMLAFIIVTTALPFARRWWKRRKLASAGGRA